ncbi:A-kinase anchor protein 9-like isoform X3 [Mya arenaria]|uniref:A-kinase anchor protein 9-like isoform X3 n=1 Tax=Mya arenaria TaxID=6604 RepID=UPI0022E93610|nr:A-kinase anchor protein 9-like isoform X3 [Mya arenaria]
MDVSGPEESVSPREDDVRLLAAGIQEKLETLKGQYDTQLEGLKSEIERSRERRRSREDDGTGGSGETLSDTHEPLQKIQELGAGLPNDKKDQLESLVKDMDQQYQAQLEDMHRQHVEDVDVQVCAMRGTLEEIYKSQTELLQTELEQKHHAGLLQVRQTLENEHKEYIAKLEQEHTDKLDELKREYSQGTYIGKEESAEFITQLNRKLTEEHRQIIQQIEADLELRGRSKDGQTDREDTVSVTSEPVTSAEKKAILNKAEDVQRSLAAQVEEIESLRARMLNEYQQMLSVRAEVMSSQSAEVEQLQREMETIQRDYAGQMDEFETKVKQQTESAVRSELGSSHARDLEEMKTYYEAKVSEITTDMDQLREEHAELLSRLQQENGGSDLPSTVHMSPGKHRDYVRHTTTLTAISDEDESPPSTPTPGTTPTGGGDDGMIENRLRTLESKLKDKEKIIDQLKKRVEAETTSAEDLHGKLLDSNKTLEDMEESLKSRADEIEDLKKELAEKVEKIIDLESEKAALEEKGEKDTGVSESGDKILAELRERIKTLENELSASKETNAKIKDEINKMSYEHGEAIVKMKEEMENLNIIKIEELEAGFKIQLEEELQQQAEELDNKMQDELRQQAEELNVFKQTESELKQKLDEIQTEHEKQLNELKEKYESESQGVVEPTIEVQETMEVQMVSPTETMDRESLEATLREELKAEILKEYEDSIDSLKNEYEERISDLNTKLQSLETKEKIESSESEDESDIKEKLRVEIAQEFKDKLQNVTDEYETKLKHLQGILDSKKESERKENEATTKQLTQSSPPYVLARSRSLDRMPSQDRSKLPADYEGFVSTIRKGYEDRINSLQREIAQYKSSVGPVPLSPLLSLTSKAQVVSSSTTDSDRTKALKASPDSVTGSSVAVSPQLRQQVYDEIHAEFQASYDQLKEDYEAQLEELTDKLNALQSDSATQGDIENKISEEYEEQIEKLKAEYEEKIAELKLEYEEEVSKLNTELEKSKSDKLAAEKKVKADMFVWHEEVTSQMKHKHDEAISAMRKEYEEKMELYQEELQEEFDMERTRMEQEHRREIADTEDRYENLMESLRKGETPEVAELVREKYDLELEMAKSLITQESEETLDAELSRLGEEKDLEIEEQRAKYEAQMVELRESLLQQYQAQLAEAESSNQAAIQALQDNLEAAELAQGVSESASEKKDTEKDTGVDSGEYLSDLKRTHEIGLGSQGEAVRSTASIDSTKMDEGEKDEEEEDVDTTGAGGRYRDGDDDTDGGAGGAKVTPNSTQDNKDLQVEQHDISHEQDGDQPDTTTGEAVGDTVAELRQQLEKKTAEYEAVISELRTQHAEEIRQLTEELSALEGQHMEEEAKLQHSHEVVIATLNEEIENLREGEATEALELAHQQELSDLENRLVHKHMNELNNAQTQYQSKLDSLHKAHASEIAELKSQLAETQKSLDTLSPRLPSFHGEITEGQDEEDFMARESLSSTDSEPKSEPFQAHQPSDTIETQAFEAQAEEEITESSDIGGASLGGTLEGIGVVSLDTSVDPATLADTSLDQSRGTLRGVDTTADTELIHFSEEEDEETSETDRSMQDAGDTGKTGRSTPPVMLQTLGYGTELQPTVKSLDDTTDSSLRGTDREELQARVKELEAEVIDLRARLGAELERQGDTLERIDREKQEERNLTAMLREDIERLNGDREAMQTTNEHLLSLLSDSVKTYMTVDEGITRRMKTMMEKSGVKVPAPGSGKRTPPPGKKSPSASPGRLSPARAEDADNLQETSILSNITDEGLDLSQRICDSIFQGPDLASEEEELLIDSGSRLRTSVTHLLEVLEETTSQLLDTRSTQAQLADTVEGTGHDLSSLMARCADLEDRLREEVERKDFLALELHKAEGLIEGYVSERETLELKIGDLEEQKETLVLSLETTKNKLHDLESMKSENEKLRQEMKEQRELMTSNVGDEAQATKAEDSTIAPSGGKALLLEVDRLNSENREREEQVRTTHERYEYRVRELETSGEDMEHHYGKLLDDKKQEVADLRLQVDALDKQLKAKKQFIEEQSAEREQEHEEYQREIEKWRKNVHDLEKHNGSESRLQTDVDELTEQLQARIDLHETAIQESDRLQKSLKERDLSVRELKTLNEQFDLDLQEKSLEVERLKEKLSKLEATLGTGDFQDDELSDSGKSEARPQGPADSIELSGIEGRNERSGPHMTVEEEIRQAADKTKEELVREKFTLQCAVNDNLVQLSSLRNQLDEMRHRRGIGEPTDSEKRLDAEREKSEEKDKQISELNLEIEELKETLGNRDQQIEQLREQRARHRTSPTESVLEYERDRDTERQLEALNRENKQLKERLKLAEASFAGDMSGLSQGLIEEKNAEIDQLSDQLSRLQADLADIKAERGVEHLHNELEALREEVSVKDREIMELQSSVRVSAAFTDNSLTPDSSLLNVGASFTDKASIAQEMEETVTARVAAGLEAEVQSLKSQVQTKEDLAVSLETELAALKEELAALKEELATLKEDVTSKDELIEALQHKPVQEGLDLEEASHMQASIAEKEGMIGQLTAEVESMQIEITDLHDFQLKLQEDYETVQTMLEDKIRENESLTDRPPDFASEEHALVIKHEVEIARLKRDLREKDNVVEEKLEELAELSDKVELLESHIAKYKEQVKDNDEQILEKDKEIKKLRREIEIASEDEKSRIIQEQKEELENLKEQVQKLLGRPPSPPKSEDEIDDAVMLGRPPSPPGENFTESKADVITRLRVEIEKLKQQIMDANLTEDDKFVLIRDLRLENETLRKQIDAALKIRPPSPPMEEDEKTQLIHEQRREIEVLRTQVETGVPRTEDEASQVIRKQEKEIVKLKKQVEAALQIAPPLPPMSEDEKDNVIEEKEMEVQTLKKELSEVKLRLDSLNSSSATSLQESVQEKEVEMSKKENKLKEAEERVKKLEEALEDAKEVKAYEDEIELKEKQDEIEELQAELETYRSREESSLSQSLEMDKTDEKSDPKQLVRSMSFYKEQYEDKCSETRQLQVQIDLIKQQLENANSEKLEDAQEEVELFRAENEQLRAKTEIFEKEREELKRELTFTRERQGKTDNEQIESLEKELQLTKDELARERLDTVEAINDLEHLRERKERERRGSLKTIQELEQDLEEKMAKEKQLNIQIKQLNEELTVIKRQYGIEDKGTGAEARTSPKSLQLRSQGSFELSNDVEILQEQVIQFKQHADKAKEILGEKQKYQSQLVKLEIQHEQLQKTMKKEVSKLEEQLKSFKTQPDKDVWTQLHATQDRLEKTSDQLAETGLHLAETESSLKQVSADLAAREDEMRGLQQDLWKTSSQLSATSTKLQETEERLRQALGQVSEREDQILHLQGEVQHPPAEQSGNISPQEVERLQDQLRSRDQELEQTTQEADRLRAQLADTKKELDEVGKSLREAVEMGEQQMSVAESKDQEFVQLKLDIQASMQEKDKLIREQKNQLKEKEKEMKKLQQDVEQRQKEVIKVTEEANKAKEEVAQTRQSGETTTIATLRAQLQNQEEVIISLETNLNEARTAVQERDTEISDIHHLASETHSQEAETVSAMHSQISNLQIEVEELRALTKLKKFSSEGSETGQSHRSGESQGRRPSPTDGADFRSSPDVSLLPGDATRRASDESFRTEGQTFLEAVQTMQDQEDSGHQSFEPSGTRERSLLRSESPEGQSLSPRQLRPQEVEILQREVVPAYMAASPSPPTRDGPEYQMVTQTSEARSRSSLKSSSPVDAEEQNGRTPSEGHSELDAQRSEDERSKQVEGQRLSPTSRISPSEIHRSLREGHRTPSEGHRTPTEGNKTPTEGHMSPSEFHKALRQGRKSSSESHRSDGHRSPSDSQGHSSRKSSPRDGNSTLVGQRSSPSQRSNSSRRSSNGRTAEVGTFTLDTENLVYNVPSSQQGAGESERYIGEDGQLYDRDGNLRPRYSQPTEVQHGVQSQSEDQSSQRDQVLPEAAQSLSSEAEKYIQQLRRELLITKTALMQIQRGERFDGGEPPEGRDLEVADEVSPRLYPVAMETQRVLDQGQGDFRITSAPSQQAELRYEPLSDDLDLTSVRQRLEKAQEELDLYRTSTNLSARDFVQKVMSLKDELSSEHQRHISELTRRASQDTEAQLAALRIKYTDEIEHLKRLHGREVDEKLHDQLQKLERKYKAETNRLVVKHQEEITALKSRAGLDFDESSVHEREARQRQDGVGAEMGLVNGHGAEPMSAKLQGILRKLHREGVQVLTISELEYLNRSQSSASLPRDADVESLRAGWENERQSMISTIQALKDLLAQTHKLRGLDKSLEGSDWRAELLRAISYVFTKERETLLAQLRSHVLAFPETNIDEVQRLEQKIRNMESQHQSAQEQIFSADRQSLLAELRDLRAHATIARLQQQEERDRLHEKLAHAEDNALKKERQLKRQELPEEPEPLDLISAGVQLLEFKIQQEKVLQEDLRTSLDTERHNTSDLSGQLSREKVTNLDLQTAASTLQGQVAKLREGLEREQSRYVSITLMWNSLVNALEEEKSKSLNLSDLLDSERQTLWRVQSELEALKQQGLADPRAIEELRSELQEERDRRCAAESQHEIDAVTVGNLQQEVDMTRRHQHAVEAELSAKVNRLQQALINEEQRQADTARALERERALIQQLQQSLDSEREAGRDRVSVSEVTLQLEAERASMEDTRAALARETRAREDVEGERRMLKEHLGQERQLNEEIKHELDKVQFERLEAINSLQKERDLYARMKGERDALTEEVRTVRTRESEREHRREEERLQGRQSAREVDRDREESRIKLREQELEVQRLSKKASRLEDQLATSQEHELRAVRDLEKLRLEVDEHQSHHDNMVSAQTSPRRGEGIDSSMDLDTSEQREKMSVYRSQLESMCQSLHYLVLRCREQLNMASHSGSRSGESSDYNVLQRSLRDLLSEVKQLQELEGGFMTHPSSTVNERVLRHNEELTNYVARISEEKTELRNTLTRLEEEIWRYRQMDAKYQAMQRTNEVSDHQILSERADWAKERLSLQMALTSAEREIGLLQTDLRVERERRVAAGNTETKDTDKVKIQRLYGKFLRAESFRKALVYQKKYLLLLLGGFQDTEETTLALLSRMGAVDSRQRSSLRDNARPLTKFRGAVRVVIAIQRMRFLVKKWRRATRVGSEVVGGSVDQSNGYVPNAASYSPPRNGHASRVTPGHARSSSSPPTHTAYRHMSPARTASPAIARTASPAREYNGTSDHHHARGPGSSLSSDQGRFLSPRFDVDGYSSSSYQSNQPFSMTNVPCTPPTKDYSSTTKYTSPSSGARRKILTSASIPAPSRALSSGRVRFTPDEGRDSLGDSDDYINRLESLQTRLGTLQNELGLIISIDGKKTSWRQAWR